MCVSLCVNLFSLTSLILQQTNPLLEVHPIACGVSFTQILQSQVRESYVTVRESYVTAYCMWSVLHSNPEISISIELVSFQQNVAKET